MTDMKRYAIVPLLSMPRDLVQYYWQSLYMADTLKYRLCDVVDPTWDTVQKMIKKIGDRIWHVVDLKDKRVCAEFAIDNFTGRSAQVHFSMHPENNTKQSLFLAKSCTDQVLNEWMDDSGHEYLHSLYGLTPVNNRVACIFVQKVGFKKIGILPSGITSRGKIVDAMLTVKTRRVNG